MIGKYAKYLELIETHLLKKYFEHQKDYIKCKVGCSFCCESGQYPFTNIEVQYLMLGYHNLDDEQKIIVQEKIAEIKVQKDKYVGEEFMYECPFLINNKCCVYDYRGIICRTHGLMFFITDKNGKSRNKCPDCVNFGLNYSNVYDKPKKMISTELWEKSGIKAEPIAYNLSQDVLLNNDATKELGLDFGESKALIDWLVDGIQL